MPGEMRKIDHRGETAIFLKVEMIGIEAGVELEEATAMSSRCKWEEETERKARAHRRRRKSLHLI